MAARLRRTADNILTTEDVGKGRIIQLGNGGSTETGFGRMRIVSRQLVLWRMCKTGWERLNQEVEVEEV